MKSRKVFVLMAVITAMTVSVCGCGKKDAAQEIGTELAAAEDTEQPAEADPKETEDTEELQVEAAVTETEEVATSQSEDSVKEMSATKYAKSTVNVRKGPSADTEKLGGLSTNQKVTVTGQADNGWYRIDFNGQSGFVSDQYLSDEKVTVASGNSKDKTNSAAGNTGSEAQGNAGTQAASGTGTTAQGNTGTQAAGNTSSSGSNSGNTKGSGSADTGNSGSVPADNGNANGLTPDQQEMLEMEEESKRIEEELLNNPDIEIVGGGEFVPATDGYGDGAVITVQPTP